MTARPAEPAFEVIREAGDWSALDAEAVAAAALGAAAAEAGLDLSGYELALLLTDDAGIARLNAGFRGRSAATNVLSWPALPLAPAAPGAPPPPPPAPARPPAPLGDLALAAETVTREAASRHLALEAHVSHLIIHGVLHLLGYDHEDEADAERMEAVERRALARIGVADPYG